MTKTQLLIFAAAFLIFSLVANLFLVMDVRATSAENSSLQAQLSDLAEEVEINQAAKASQANVLTEMGNQQREMSDIVIGLQTELKTITDRYAESLSATESVQAQLRTARAQMSALAQEAAAEETQRIQLASDLAEAEQQLEEARKTISNQQRALRSASGSLNTAVRADDLTELTTSLQQQFADARVAETQSSQILISVALEALFAENNLDLAENANALLGPIADFANRYEASELEIIGHADARLIVSPLREQYPTNWELSSARAAKVVRALEDLGIDSARMLAAGKAANQPISDDQNSTALATNRRIDILITP